MELERHITKDKVRRKVIHRKAQYQLHRQISKTTLITLTRYSTKLPTQNQHSQSTHTLKRSTNTRHENQLSLTGNEV